ncbi:membrane protein [Streptomyces violascens]|uniref:Membrane protein n=2 Tax=Streptomyces violascens TaxID=67381 RepID=A0ABQ3QML8_9ACTN|nr:membrane protein [Streptomyces violascens]GHI38519.1 membrane protein [Streptomyces violascens]GHI38538.1 membrane protein [Streptomyces violascens]GHI39004.1 membrane protein [Streptomyces violascens]GHI39715.1 membrane protein [Streptomyces violascens]
MPPPPARVRIPAPAPAPDPGAFGRRTRSAALVASWLATRALMLHLLVADRLGVGGVTGEVYVLYRRWYEQLGTGAFPFGDPTWQYPPGAGVIMLAPALLPFLTFFQAFTAVTVGCDALIARALVRAGARPGGSVAGAWLWVAGLPLLLHIPYARYDVQVTAVAVGALLALRRRPGLGGALAGIGTLVKVWPLLTLIGAPPGRGARRALLGALGSAAALLAVLALAFDHTLDFARQQGGRGLQIESLGGTALQLAHLLTGHPGRVVYRYGAMEFTGPYVSALATLSLALTGLALCWLLFWRVRARRWTVAVPLDAALCAVLLFTVTSRVISPQYLIWLLGLAAACLTSRQTAQRPVARLLLPTAALSALAFPCLYDEVMAGSALGTGIMAARNTLLLAAALLSCRRLWTSTVTSSTTTQR